MRMVERRTPNAERRTAAMARERWLGRLGRLAIAAVAMLAAACSGSGAAKENDKAAGSTPPPVMEISRENTVEVTTEEIRTGPVISGTLTPKTHATVRAEVGGAVLAVLVEQGQPVRQGQLLARIEARTQGEAVTSAESAMRSQEQALALARRELARAETLVAAGAAAGRTVETARNAVVAAESDLATANSQLISARETLGDATVSAPISGVVADRPVNAGDVVSPGTALYTIVDPTSIQLEASVPSEALSAVRIGARVRFEVRGYPDQTFSGRVERISPTADPTTRQVPIWVTVDNRGGRLVSGLFADGRVTQAARRGLVVPLNIVTDPDGQASVLRITEGKVERVSVQLGLRDTQTERVEVTSGLSEGDLLLTGVAQGVTPGTALRVRNGEATAPR